MINNNILSNFIVILLLLLVMLMNYGCAQKKIISQKDYFFMNNPELVDKYIVFAPISFDSYRHITYSEYSVVIVMLNILRKKFSSDSKVIGEIDRMEDIYMADYEERLNYINNIHKSDLILGDEIYFFEFVDKEKSEFGELILNNGSIRKRFVSGGSQPSRSH